MNNHSAYLLFLLIFCCINNAASQTDTVKTSFDFNKDWEFVKDADTTIAEGLFDRSDETYGWEEVRLPHTAHIEPLVIEDQQWQGTSFYRKFFDVDPELEGKYIALHFEAAMHEANIYLNGEEIDYHAGGYLPSVVNISEKVSFDEENVLLIRLDNEDNSEIPPGKPIETLDFNYYGGIYRDAKMVIKNPLRISHPIEAERVAAGGIFVWYKNVSEEKATVVVQADIENGRSETASARLNYILEDKDGNTVTTNESEITVEPDSNGVYKEEFVVENPALWSPDNPSLYTLTVQLYDENGLVDSIQQRIGIRTFGFDEENQFTLNGERLYLRGTNRHQDYPYIGYALSNEAQYRDAYKIKEAGFNFIRTAHYPPDPAFLEACDELGILFMNAIPGWQFYEDGIFAKNSLQDIQKMVRRDRNHPSIVFWEASLNESNMPETFMDQANQIVKEELPIEDVYTSGWIDYAYDIYIPARQHSRPPEYWSEYDKDKPLFIAEYGDWEYYAQNAGFNQDAFEDLQEDERNSRQLRGDGQRRLAQQALNFQEAHNSNLYSPAFGDANWVMYDYNRGYAPDLEASGIMDIFRIPKFTYYFYQSQADPDLSEGAEFNKPMVYIANYWSDPDFTEVKVYSNTEEVELYLNEELIDTRQPDTNRVSTNLKHPPFTFNPDFESGTLRAVGYVDDEAVAEHERNTPGEPTVIQLSADISNRNLKAGVKDVIFVYAAITDEDGVIVPGAENEVLFNIEGDAEIIGGNPFAAEAGIATILLQAGESAGEVVISAESDGLESDDIELEVE